MKREKGKKFIAWLVIFSLAITAMLQFPIGIAEGEETNRDQLLNQSAQAGDKTKQSVKLRKFPYPYRGMLSISTDIDGTAIQEFREIHRFLNTLENTKMGAGVGLDIADSFWMYNMSDRQGYIDAGQTMTWQEQISYFHGDDWNQPYQAEEIQKYIEAGWIDTLHSYGDYSRTDPKDTRFTRQHAVEALEELNKQGIAVTVWVNHGSETNIQNFGGNYNFTAYQQGDTPGTTGYHTDLTVPYGIRFLWDSMGDENVGRPSVIYPITLRDGQKMWGFKRYTYNLLNRNGDKEWLWNIYKLDKQLSAENLDKIVENGWYSIISNHLGNGFGDGMFPTSAVSAFHRLKAYQDEGKILVARTSRLLEYNRTHYFLNFRSVNTEQGRWKIHIEAVNDPLFGRYVPSLDQVRGITFYVPEPQVTDVFIGGWQVPADLLQINPSDGAGTSVGIRWFSPDYRDYTLSPH